MGYSVYVVELSPEAQTDDRPAVYVGATGLDPEERFENHKAGRKAAKVVKKHGVRLRSDLYPAPAGSLETWTQAAGEETRWAEVLRDRGFYVYGGH